MRALTVASVVLLAACGGSTAEPAPTTSTTTSAAPALLRFETTDLAGFCEDSLADLAEGEPGLATPEDAVAQFIREHAILRGLQFEDGGIWLRDKRVGRYSMRTLPGDTFMITEASWCYPDG